MDKSKIKILVVDDEQGLCAGLQEALQREGHQVDAAKSAAGEAVVLRVQDNGPGIPKDKLEEVFDPYFTTKAEGIGLGLWIARQIAVAHGGSLRAENAPAGGAIFTLLLPLSRKENPGG